MAVMMEDHRLYDAHDRASRAALAGLERFAAIQTGQGRHKHFETTGDFLSVLEQHSQLRFSELQDIRRQIPADYNRAIRFMARGDVTEGLEQLNQLGCLHEGKGHYLRQAAAAFVEATSKGKSLDRCIAIAPTWDENHRLTEAIREQLKQSGRLHSPTPLQIQDPLDWTAQQRAEARRYRPGIAVTLTRRAAGLEPGQSLVVERVEAGRLYFQNHSEPFDPARHVDKLQVAIPRQIELASGDPILIQRNARKLGLINGEVLTSIGVQSDGSIQTREDKTIPSTFRDFCHGYVVTSHKSQGRTHDQVIVALPSRWMPRRSMWPVPAAGIRLLSLLRTKHVCSMGWNNRVTGWRLPMFSVRWHCGRRSGGNRNSEPGRRQWNRLRSYSGSLKDQNLQSNGNQRFACRRG